MANILNCIVVDDEPIWLALLKMYVEKVPFLSLKGAYDNAMEALPLLAENKIDLVITDVQMPGLTGMQLARTVSKEIRFIFISSLADHAVQGFELEAIDYLLKPIAFERFLQAVQKALKSHSQDKSRGKPQPNDALFIKVNSRIIRLDFSHILFIEARKEYVSIVTTTSRLLAQLSMRQMENVLEGKKFARVHKSFIVSLDKIEEIERSRIRIKDSYIPIGPNYKNGLLDLINPANS